MFWPREVVEREHEIQNQRERFRSEYFAFKQALLGRATFVGRKI
jgi:hypothetical protein